MRIGFTKFNISILLLLAGLVACNGANFQGGSGSSSAPPTPETTTTTTIPKEVPPTDKVCKEGQESIGANIVFLIDNSNSNSVTDCPSSTAIGGSGNSQLFKCGSQTNRERAVLSAFDTTAEVAAKEKKDIAVSNIAVVQFPANATSEGSTIMTNGWLKSSPKDQNRSSLETALGFTRQPGGSTPYGAAIESATNMFSSVSNDGKSRVAILVTDGEPTDRDPGATSERAKQLRSLGVEVITVFITSGQTRTQRLNAHVQMIGQWDQTYAARGQHWYAQRYSSLDQYLNELMGRNGQASLAQNVTSQTDPQCTDKQGSICQRNIVEISDASALTAAVQQIIRTRAVKCQ